MIRDIPNRYEKLNFSSDDIQNQLEGHSQGTLTIGINTNVNINPIFSKPNIKRDSVSILNSKSSLSSSDQSSSRSSSASSQSSDPGIKGSKSLEHIEVDQNNQKDKQIKYQKLILESFPASTNNPNSIKESLLKPLTLFNTKNKYYISSNGETFHNRRRLLSFNGEETGEFRELVTFLDKVQHNNELPANKMIRKNSCSCMNCGSRSSKQVRLDKLIPKFKPTQVIRNMYRKTFQKTISNISKINKFFRSKLQIRTKNNNNLVFGEKKASPTKFMRQSTFKISPKSLEKKSHLSRDSSMLPENGSQKLQQLGSNLISPQQSINQNPQLLQQNSTNNNIVNNNQNKTNNELNFKKKPVLMTRNSLFIYSDGEQHQQFVAKLQQLPISSSPYKRSVQNNDQIKPLQLQQIQTDKYQNGNQIEKSSPTKLINVQSSPLPQQLQNNGSSPNTPIITKIQKPLALQLDQLKLKQTPTNILVEDNIIDQLRQETQMGNINNDFVKSVGNNILRQTLNNSVTREGDVDSDKQKSKRTEIILEDTSELVQQSQMPDFHKSRFVSSYYRHLPKLSNKYLNPVLQQIKKDSQYNKSETMSTLLKNGEIGTEFSLDKKSLKKYMSIPLLDSRIPTQSSDAGRENAKPKNNQFLSQSNIFATQNSLKNSQSLFNLNQFNHNHAQQSQFHDMNSIQKNRQDGKNKIRMKRNQKISITSQPSQIDSVYLRAVNQSCMTLQNNRQKSSLPQRPPFNLSTQSEQIKQNDQLLVQKNKKKQSLAFSLLPKKLNSIITLNNIPHNIGLALRKGVKASLPDINKNGYLQNLQLRNKSQEQINNLSQNIDSPQLLPSSFSQISKNQLKDDSTPSKKMNKKKKLNKNKLSLASKNILIQQEIYHTNKKQSN